MKIDFQGKMRAALLHHGRQMVYLAVAVLLIHDVFGTHGFLAMHHKQQEIQKANAEIERLNKKNATLEMDVKDLKSDPQTIRKIAREELGLARPGEVIIKLPVPPPAEPPAVKP